MDLGLGCVSQYKNCVKGIPCGNTCIAKGKNCKPKPNAKANAVANLLANPDNLEKGAEKSGIKVLESIPESKEVIGKGGFGEVYLTPEGTAFKSAYEGKSISKDESDIMVKAGELGVAPQVKGIYTDANGSIKGIEMDYLSDHTPLFGLLQENRSAQIGDKGTESLSQSLAQLHKNGIVHGDFHGRNVMFSKEGDAKIVDYGLSSKINQNDPKPEQLQRWREDVLAHRYIYENFISQLNK